MTEEVKNLESNPQEVIPNDPPTNEPSQIEQRAIDLGWRPKDDFDGDEATFIDAAEFVRRQPLFDKIESMGRELKETKKVLNLLQEHHKKVKETEFNRALDELKAEKKKALEDGDADKLLAVDDAIAEIRTAQITKQNEPQEQPQLHPDFVNWVNRNKWYAKDPEMRAFADAVGLQYKDSSGASNEDVLKYVEQRVKATYKDKFVNPNRTKPNAVENNNSVVESKNKADSFELSEDERKAMNTFVRNGVMTKEEYIAEIKKLRG